MTCCDAMREEIRKWLNPPRIGLQPGPPLRFLRPRDDGVVRCSLCGAEWGPVKATEKPQEADRITAALADLIQSDPHQWSARPCATCTAATALVGKPFGCVAKQQAKGQKP